MIITGAHWVVATLIAVSIHVAGMLWLSIASPERQPEARDASEGIVVTLGRGERDVAESPRAPTAETGVPAASEPRTAQPDPPTTEENVPEQAAVEPKPAIAEAETVETSGAEAPEAAASPDVETPETVNPQTVESRRLDEAGSVDPESAGIPDPSRADTVEPTRDATTPEQAEPAPEAIPGASPVASGSVDVEEAPARSAPPGAVTETQETEAVEAPRTTVEPSDTTPAEFAHDAPVPEPAAATSAVQDTRNADPGDTPAVETPPAAGPAPASGSAKPVEDVETAAAEQTAPRMELGAVAPETGNIAEPDVAAARQPAPQVEQLREPEAAETATPETVKLQELQERSGGEGVVAHYAGVLKGWLQKNMHYPRAARLTGQEGDVVVRFVIDRQGNVQAVELESGSGHRLLDREATEMVERGDPFPAMPEDMPGERLEVRVPVSFHVRDETRTKDLPPIYLE